MGAHGGSASNQQQLARLAVSRSTLVIIAVKAVLPVPPFPQTAIILLRMVFASGISSQFSGLRTFAVRFSCLRTLTISFISSQRRCRGSCCSCKVENIRYRSLGFPYLFGHIFDISRTCSPISSRLQILFAGGDEDDLYRSTSDTDDLKMA